jgi:hypothetical protein
LRLEIAAEGGVEHEGERAPTDGAQVAHGLLAERIVDADLAHYGVHGPGDGGDGRAEKEAGDDAGGKPGAAFVAVAAAEGLGNESIEAEQHAEAEDGEGVIEPVAKSDGAEHEAACLAGHEGIDDAHAHPAELGQYQGHGQPEHGT